MNCSNQNIPTSSQTQSNSNLDNESVTNDETQEFDDELADTCNTDEADVRKRTLIQQYAKGRPTIAINDSTLRSLTRAIRLVIIPKVKFLPGLKGFGSFEQPDFTHPNCWVNKVFDRIANLKNASDKKKADIWMAYRSKIKEQFSLHRSGVTLKIKNSFLKGKKASFHMLKRGQYTSSLSHLFDVKHYLHQRSRTGEICKQKF